MRINATEQNLYVNIGTLQIKKSQKLKDSGSKYWLSARKAYKD